MSDGSNKNDFDRVSLLALSGLCCFGPAGLESVLPAVNIAEWTVVPDVPGLSSLQSVVSPQSQSAEGAAEQSREARPYEEPLYSRPPRAETPSGEEVLTPPVPLLQGVELLYLYRKTVLRTRTGFIDFQFSQIVLFIEGDGYFLTHD